MGHVLTNQLFALMHMAEKSCTGLQPFRGARERAAVATRMPQHQLRSKLSRTWRCLSRRSQNHSSRSAVCLRQPLVGRSPHMISWQQSQPYWEAIRPTQKISSRAPHGRAGAVSQMTSSHSAQRQISSSSRPWSTPCNSSKPCSSSIRQCSRPCACGQPSLDLLLFLVSLGLPLRKEGHMVAFRAKETQPLLHTILCTIRCKRQHQWHGSL